MAFDACMMRATLSEFRTNFPEAKVEKVLQPRNDEIDLLIHFGRQSGRLLFNVGPNAPRLQLTSIPKDNPVKAPMLCMHLRKLFSGARITDAHQLGFDRIAVFTLACYDEMGFPTERHLICEIMGKYANLIVTDGEDKIITAMKIIDFAASTVRQVLPGLKYQVPAVQDKICPLDFTAEEFLERLSAFPEERTGEKFITSTYSGIATQIAHELVYRASGRIDVPIVQLDRDKLLSVVSDWVELLREERYTPTVAIDKSGKPIDYSYMDISYLGDAVKICHLESLGEMFDLYFAEKDRQERIHQRAHDLVTLLSQAIARTERKLAIQRESLCESERGEEYKKKGDLITANLYRLERGMPSFCTVDYYDESCPEITVELDTRLSPSQNAQRMYKLYSKAKTAREVLTEQIARWEEELRYLETVKGFRDRSQTEEDLVEIRDELYKSGYSSRMKGYQPSKKVKPRPIELRTSGGFRVLVGRNNIQNDFLTFKLADKNDIWFHTKDIPGSHCILVTDGEEPGDGDYTEAAAIAAYYSQATADLVAVDYTRVKNIKKPPSSKPGFVTYKTNYTAFVRRDLGKELAGG